jgi:uncharacterized protein YecE (DUF72 family)
VQRALRDNVERALAQKQDSDLAVVSLTEPLIVGTAGWSIPKAVAASFAGGGSNLERYARRFAGVEINSTFYRTHRAATYARWRSSVPEGFRFAVKIPKVISHEKRLVGAEEEFRAFLSETAELGESRGPLLLQLPPKLAFDEVSARQFLDIVRTSFEGDFVVEPRHPSWFNEAVDELLQTYSVARVGADPPRGGAGVEPGGFGGLTYLRLHGSPRVYFSAYQPDQLAAIANVVRQRSGKRWVIFDNTASGAAAANALQLVEDLAA